MPQASTQKPHTNARGLFTKTLTPSDLARCTDSKTYSLGQDLFLAGNVEVLSIACQEAGCEVTGLVKGLLETPYSTNVTLFYNTNGKLDDWDGECTCPVYDDCEHAVALALTAANSGTSHADLNTDKKTTSKAPPNEDVVVSTTHATHDQTLLDWLEQIQPFNDAIDSVASKNPHTDRNLSSRAGVETPPDTTLFLLKAGVRSATPSIQAFNAQPRSSQSKPAPALPELLLSVTRARIKRGGGWTRPRAFSYSHFEGEKQFADLKAVDKNILQLARTLLVDYSYYSENRLEDLPLKGELGMLTLQRAAQTGRLMLVDDDGYPNTPLVWGQPIALDWQWKQTSSDHWRLFPKLDSDTAKIFFNQPLFYLDSVTGCCGLIETPNMQQAQVESLFCAPEVQATALLRHQDLLLERLEVIPLPPVFPDLERIEGVLPNAILQFEVCPPHLSTTLGHILSKLTFDYGGVRGFWAHFGTKNVRLVADDVHPLPRLLCRNIEVEQGFIHVLEAFGLEVLDDGSVKLRTDINPSQWLTWADNDFDVFKASGFSVDSAANLLNWVVRADALHIEVNNKTASPSGAEFDANFVPSWFDLSLGLEVNGQRQNLLPWLPHIIQQIRYAEADTLSTAPLLPPHLFLPAQGATGFIRVDTEPLKPWLTALLELVGDRHVNYNEDTIKLSRLEALRAAASLGQGAVWTGEQSIQRLLSHIRGQTPLPEVALPAEVHADLRPYQLQGLQWLQFLRTHQLSGILADDMGLGKTLQTLAHIQLEKSAGRLNLPVLVIAPVSVLSNWQREASRFCPDLKTLLIHGKDRANNFDSMREVDVVIAPYSLLGRDNEKWLTAQWHLVVLDEAQNIKNAHTQAAKVVFDLHTRHRLCLSGTPMENHLGEMWSLFHFLMPGFLGSEAKFKTLYRNPIERNGSAEHMARLRSRITPFMLRRTKNLVATELPPKIESVINVELEGKQADLYETIRLSMEASVRDALHNKGLARSQITILDALLKLRQVCCDPRLIKLDAARQVSQSAKLNQLLEMLPDMLAEGRRILIFSQFTSMLTLIEQALAAKGMNWVKLTGQSKNRDALIQRFTSGEVPLFLISLKAGGVGLNLPEADTVIHYDPWWNPAVENQATDRAHRIGQTRSVWVVKLVAAGTIEERILNLQERKASLAQDVYSGAAERKEPLFGEDDLQELLKPLGA